MYIKNKERWEKGDHSRLVGNRFALQGSLHTRFVLVTGKTSRSLHVPARILRVYIEALMGFSHVFGPDGLNNTAFSPSSPSRTLLVSV